ncbi:thiol:disulfide interchange protein DsbA/DsbL [Frateuria aurantia]
MLKRFALIGVAALGLNACSQSGPSAPAPAASSTATAPAASVAAPPAAATSPAPAASAPASTASTAPEQAASPAPASTAPFVDNGRWVEGKNYFTIDPAQPTSHPGKIEVTEVFSYGCPACNAFHPIVDTIAHSLPSNAVMNYIAAGFRPDENWVVYQQAYYASAALGIADKTYDASFDGVWKSGEISSYNLSTGQLAPKSAWPDINKLAQFYAHYGVDPKEFVAVANSFAIKTQINRANQMIAAYGVEGTPTIIVNGHYRFDPGSAGGYPQAVELTKFLVAKEAAGK